MVPFEEANSHSYILLLRIEIALRESLRDCFQAEYKSKWQRQLPGPLLTKIRDAQKEEQRPQFDFVRLGPLYYLTFGELLTILQQTKGRPVANRFGGEAFLKQLENIFSPRNALCHSRPVSSVGSKAIETVYAQMEASLTKEGLARLVANPDVGVTQGQLAVELVEVLRQFILEMPQYPSTFRIPQIVQIAEMQYWWSEDDLAGFKCSSINSLIELLGEYNALPIGVGSAGIRQRFLEEKNLRQKIEESIKELEKVNA